MDSESSLTKWDVSLHSKLSAYQEIPKLIFLNELEL